MRRTRFGCFSQIQKIYHAAFALEWYRQIGAADEEYSIEGIQILFERVDVSPFRLAMAQVADQLVGILKVVEDVVTPVRG